MFKEILKQDQPVAYRVLQKALQQKRLAHAYLFVGANKSYKKETAMLLAQSLICTNTTDFACEVCDDCVRVKTLNYSDIKFLDGSQTSIKKDDVLQVQKEFSQTALEKANQKVYILNQIENATTEAMNSLLKFLEEPESQRVTAILIADDIERVLPTIVSRCQVIVFKNNLYETCYQENIKAGLDDFDAYLLSKITYNFEASQEVLIQESYLQAKDAFVEFVQQFAKQPLLATTFLQVNLFKTKNKTQVMEAVKYFYEMMVIFFEDIVTNNIHSELWWEQTSKLYHQAQAGKMLECLIQQQAKINRYNNLPLLIDQTIYQLKEVTL